MGVLFSDEVFVEPVGLFDLETYSGDGDEFFGGDVDYEATAQRRLVFIHL